MRRTTKINWYRWAAALVGALVSVFVSASAHATGGSVTITPATATISLPVGQHSVQSRFTITNNYQAAIVLHFAFAQPITTPGAAKSALTQLSVGSTDLPVAAGASVQQSIILTDSPSLAPGSQQVELVVTQLATAGTDVGVTPSIRMPLIIVKQDGAVAGLNANTIGKPAVAWLLPSSFTIQVRNIGNVLAIPRGYVRIEDPRGRVISKGIINNASVAVSPGSQAQLSTPTASLDRAWLPGLYRVSMVYGLGGGQATKTVSARFVYVPAWEVSILAALAIMVFAGRQLTQELLVRQRFKRAPRPPSAKARPTGHKAVKRKRKVI